MRVIFTYQINIPLNSENPVRTREIHTTFPPLGRPEYEKLTETEVRTLVFAELNRLEKLYGEVSVSVKGTK